jgi:hypothetical protein
MAHVLDDVVVGLALLASLGYALAKLGPKAWRTRALNGLARIVASAPAALRLGGLAHRLAAAAEKATGGCGGCGSCGTEADAGKPGAAPEVHIPLAKIGRRG